MKSNNLFESIKENLTEATKYECAPSYNEEDGFYSMTNTEAFEMGKSVAQYFADYANFLTNDEEGARYIDRKMASEFAKLAQDLNASLDKISQGWDEI